MYSPELASCSRLCISRTGDVTTHGFCTARKVHHIRRNRTRLYSMTPEKSREPGASTSMIPVSTSKSRMRSESVGPASCTPAPELSTSAQPDESSRTIARTTSSSSVTSVASSTSMLSSVSNQKASKPVRPLPSTGYQRPASLVSLSSALNRLNAPMFPGDPNSSGFMHGHPSKPPVPQKGKLIRHASCAGNPSFENRALQAQFAAVLHCVWRDRPRSTVGRGWCLFQSSFHILQILRLPILNRPIK